MKEIELMKLVPDTGSNAAGDILYSQLKEAIVGKQGIRISLHKATPMSSSFLNSSFGRILEENGMDAIKKYVVLSHYIPSHAKAIKKYLDRYSDWVLTP